MRYNFNFGDGENEGFEEEFKRESGKESEELKDMIEYEERTKGELKRIRTNSDFSYAVTQELKSQGLDIGILEKLLYNERNFSLELSERFKKGELKNWNLSDLNEGLSEISDKLEFLDKINETYLYLTGESSDFYNQHKKFAEESIEHLDLEIMNRKMEGDYR